MIVWHYGNLPIARFDGKTIKPMTNPNPYPRPMTMEDIIAKQSRLNVLRPAKESRVSRRAS